MAPRNWTWGFFVKGKKQFGNNKTNYEAFCVACVAYFSCSLERADQQAVANGGSIALVRNKGEIYKEACRLAKPICGRPADFRRHIKTCPHVSEEAKEQLRSEEADSGPANDSAGAAQSVHQISATATSATLDHHPKTQPVHLTYTELQGYHRDLLHFFKWLPGPELPTRQALGGRILQAAVKDSKARMKAAMDGKMATGISDGWKTYRKALLACMINVDYESHTVKVVDTSALPKTANNHLEVVKSVIRFCEDNLHVKIIGWVSDAGGDSRAMRVRLVKERPELIQLDCWAHQLNLVLGDLFKIKSELVSSGSDAHRVVKWFLSHTRAFALLQGQQTKSGGRAHSYILANITRWTSHCLSIQSLVDDEGPMRATVALYRKELERIGSGDRERATFVLDTVSRPEFWDNIKELVSYLRPLAIALNVAQATDTRLDHILLTLGNLFRLFNVSQIDPLVRACILASLELRWSKSDQDVFILAVFFNPYIRALLFNPHNPAFCINGLYTTVKRVFERVFKTSAGSGLFEAYVDYFNWRNEFSREAWHLDEYARMYTDEGKSVNLTVLWAALPYPGTINTGRNQFAHLARLVVCIVANSANVERLFSRMNYTHGKRRNRMHPDKVHDLATVAMDLEAQHRAAGLVRKRARRHLEPEPTDVVAAEDDDIDDSASEDLDDEGAPVDIKTLAARLAEATDDDNDDTPEGGESDSDLPEPAEVVAESTRQPRVRLFFSSGHQIPLRELFNFSDTVEGVEDGLGFFWKGGIHNLSKEREVYEALASEHVPNLGDD
ncbi:hypothetical protein RhiJN_05932 [Ceratobasidium sp. AG-Ba]|nr:hypothetical protein RhiJN_05932 [Ceratobasidium sp. AG-Ba]QRW06856.1 hypothetical protein RhiLY_05855 [Ceratobasidium sp. AG-Ba]